MKRFNKTISALLVFAMALSFTACNDKDSKKENSDVSEPSQAVTENAAEVKTENVTESETEAPTKTAYTDYVSAYKEYLKKYMQSDEFNPEYAEFFSLHYLDDDSIPELFISEGDGRGSGVAIMTFDGQYLKELTGDMGHSGVIGFAEKKGIVVETDTARSQITAMLYKIENEGLKEYWSSTHFLGGYPDEDTPEHYRIDGEVVEKAEYERELKANMPDVILTNIYSHDAEEFPTLKFDVDGEEYEINADNIEKYIK